MKRKMYRRCLVPKCGNNSVTSPNKIFIEVPRKKAIRKIWLELAGWKSYKECVTTKFYFCEDHFDLPNVMKNYMMYHIKGFVSKIMLNPGCLPSKFECQTNKDNELLAISTSWAQQELLKETELKSTTKEEKTILPQISEAEVVNVDHNPKSKNCVKNKYMRSKCPQTYFKFKTIALLPYKTSILVMHKREHVNNDGAVKISNLTKTAPLIDKQVPSKVIEENGKNLGLKLKKEIDQNIFDDLIKVDGVIKQEPFFKIKDESSEIKKEEFEFIDVKIETDESRFDDLVKVDQVIKQEPFFIIKNEPLEIKKEFEAIDVKIEADENSFGDLVKVDQVIKPEPFL